MRALEYALAPVLWVTLLACHSPQGQVCQSGSQCPPNWYCLSNQCVAPSTISQNLSVVVIPTDRNLATQQFLPTQMRTVDGFSTILLQPPKTLAGHVALPPNCGDAGYPVRFQFTGPTLIPGIPNGFQFETDLVGNLSASLPVGTYAERVSPSMACAAPFIADETVTALSSNLLEQVTFPAPSLGAPEVGPEDPDGGAEDGGGDAGPAFPLSLDASGQVQIQTPAIDGGLAASAVKLPVNATVRILQLIETDAGPLAGSALSGDQPLQVIDGGLWFGMTFVPGGPATLPVSPSEVNRTTGLNLPCVFTAIKPSTATCDQFIVEIGPSQALPFLTTFDVQVSVQELDAGGNSAVILGGAVPAVSTVPLPFNPMLTVDLPIVALDPANNAVTSSAVTISSVDGGITACGSDGRVTCHLNASGTTDPATGALTFPVVAGRYALTLEPPTPLGSSVTIIDVLDGGQLSIVSGPGLLDAGVAFLHAAPAFELQGTVREDEAGQPLIGGGEVQLLSVADLVPVALQALTNGQFDLLVPPGQYILSIQPDSSTRFAAYANPITIDRNLLRQTYLVTKPSVLAGIVELEQNGSLPVPVQAYLEFYYVTSTDDGSVVTLPVGTALTDSQGRWSAPGPQPPAQ